MKNKAILLLIVLSVILIFSGCSFSKEASAESAEKLVIELGDNLSTSNSLTVTATGSVNVTPDVAYVTIGVSTKSEDMVEAQDMNAEIMNSVFAALKQAGLSEDDMRTTDYSAYPYHDYNYEDDKEDEVIMYEVTNRAELTIKDIDNVGGYIDVAMNNGANITHSVRFSILDQTSYYNQALEDAVAKAKEKADTIAAAGEYTITGTLEVTEGAAYNDRYFAYDVAMEENDMGATPITYDDLEITASITIVYKIQ